MKSDVQFSEREPKVEIRLFSIGRGFIPEEEMAVLSDSSECAKIEDVRKQFRRRALKKQAGAGERKSRDERPFVNKTQFILSRKQELYGDSLLLDLLADQTTLFSRSYQVYATDHRVYLKLRRQSETQMHVYLDEALANVPCEEKESYEKILRRIAEKAAQEERPLHEVGREVMEKVTNQNALRQEEKSISQNNSEEDVLRILNDLPFFHQKRLIYYIKRLLLEKAEVRHHTVRYYVYDRNACEAYLKRKKRLQKVLEQYQEWKKQDEMSAFPLSQDSVVDSTCYYAKEQKTSIPVEEIIKATKDYLLNTRGGAKHFSDILAKTVVIETVSNSNNMAQFPIRYLMICVAGSSQLFSTPRVLTAQALSDVLKSPYYQKPTKWKQRICRISFLHQLHEICGLKKEERSESWKCFLQIHGSVIQSSEEDDLWREVIYGAEQDFHNPKEEIAPIELNLLCSECLQTCLPIQPERLYGYQGCSPLHLGGFARFLREYPDALPAIVEKVSRQPKRWGDVQEQYLKLWSAIPCNLEEICGLLRRGCGMIRWGWIPNASQEELHDFCQSLRIGESNEDRITADIEELKMLLIEMALRTVLADQARQVLADKIEEAWSKDSDLKIRVSFPKRSRTEEL